MVGKFKSVTLFIAGLIIFDSFIMVNFVSGQDEPPAEIWFQGQNSTFYPNSLNLLVRIIPKKDAEYVKVRLGGDFLTATPSERSISLKTGNFIDIQVKLEGWGPVCTKFYVNILNADYSETLVTNNTSICIAEPISLQPLFDVDQIVKIQAGTNYTLSYRAKNYGDTATLTASYKLNDGTGDCQGKNCDEMNNQKYRVLGEIAPNLTLDFNITVRARDYESEYTTGFQILLNNDFIEYYYKFENGIILNAKKVTDIQIKTYFPVSIFISGSSLLSPGTNIIEISITNNLDEDLQSLKISLSFYFQPFGLIEHAYYKTEEDSNFYQKDVKNRMRMSPDNYVMDLKSNETQYRNLTIILESYPIESYSQEFSLYVKVNGDGLQFQKQIFFDHDSPIIFIPTDDTLLTAKQDETEIISFYIKNKENQTFHFSSCGYILDRPQGNVYNRANIIEFMNEKDIVIDANATIKITSKALIKSSGIYQIVPYCLEKNDILFFQPQINIVCKDTFLEKAFLGFLPVVIILVITLIAYIGRPKPSKNEE